MTVDVPRSRPCLRALLAVVTTTMALVMVAPIASASSATSARFSGRVFCAAMDSVERIQGLDSGYTLSPSHAVQLRHAADHLVNVAPPHYRHALAILDHYYRKMVLAYINHPQGQTEQGPAYVERARRLEHVTKLEVAMYTWLSNDYGYTCPRGSTGARFSGMFLKLPAGAAR